MLGKLRFVALLALLGTICCMQGCTGGDSKPEGLPDLHAVTLTVTQDGSPLAGASVQLVPADPSSNKWVSGGTTDADGNAEIKTHGKFPGAPAGKYKVTISKTLTEDLNPEADANDPMAEKKTKIYDLVDLKFGAAATTTAEIEVVAGSNSPEPIDVGAAIKEAQPEM